jgi:hypothetical protein
MLLPLRGRGRIAINLHYGKVCIASAGQGCIKIVFYPGGVITMVEI